MPNPIKVVFVLPSLRAGGAERVMSFIAQNISSEKFSAELVIIGHEKDKKFDVTDVPVTYLNYNRVSRSYFKLLKTLRRKKPDIVISSIGHVNIIISLVSLLYKKPKYIGREANVNSARRAMNTEHNSFRKFLHDRSFWILDAIICQSEDMLHDLNTHLNIDLDRFIIINNPITDGFELKDKTIPSEPIRYITVGALHERKGHRRLLEVLAQVDHPFHYTMIGSGSKLPEITTYIEYHGLKDSVTHIPFTKEVSRHLSESDVFLNGSYVEGFPNVIIESCAVGTPVIAFNAPGGINEIIRENINGHIVEDHAEFIEKLNSINSQYKFDKSAVRESVMSRYSKDIILNKYESLFTRLMEGKKVNP